MRSFANSLSSSESIIYVRVVFKNYYEGKADVKADYKPGIALTDSKVSAMCCNRLEVDSERRVDGKVTTATAFEDRTIPFKDLIKESMSHSWMATVIMFNKLAFVILSIDNY